MAVNRLSLRSFLLLVTLIHGPSSASSREIKVPMPAVMQSASEFQSVPQLPPDPLLPESKEDGSGSGNISPIVFTVLRTDEKRTVTDNSTIGKNVSDSHTNSTEANDFPRLITTRACATDRDCIERGSSCDPSFHICVYHIPVIRGNYH